MSDCRNLEPMLAPYVDGEAEPRTRAAVDGHLAACPPCRDRVAAVRQRITTIASAHGLAAIPSATNFVTIDCGGDGMLARRVLETLIARDVFVRKPMVPVLDRCIRVSVGRDEELDIFEEELPAALRAASAG